MKNTHPILAGNPKVRPSTSLSKSLSVGLMALIATASIANSGGHKILHEIDALKKPVLDHAQLKNEAYMKDYRAQALAYQREKNDLIWELYQTDPSNPKTASLLVERWTRPIPVDGKDYEGAAKLENAEIDSVLAQNPTQAIKEAGDYSKVELDNYGNDEKKSRADLDAFVAKYPKSDRSPQLLFRTSFSAKEADRPAIYKRILTDYPNFKDDAMIRGALRSADAMGKPFAFSFTDVTSGKRVDLSSYKGKVVLVDFWATWCGPCVAEFPQVKELYTKYHDKGVEIVGISLDEPEAKDKGLTKLKEFVAKNQIPWPMYYQGKGWDSKFSTSWGIMSIPAMFIIDKNGNFQGSTDVRDPDFTPKLDRFLSQ